MIAHMLYNRQTPGERVVQALAKELEAEQVEVELLDADSSRGIQLAEHYDVVGRPAILLVKEDGAPVRVWQAEDDWPTAVDISYLAHQ